MSITGSLDLARAILSGAPSGANVSGSLVLQRAILAAAPSSGPAISGSLDVTRRIYGSDTIDLVLIGAPLNLVGVLTIEIATANGDIIVPATTGGIVEQPPGTGRYVATVPAFDTGTYYATWSDGANSVTVSIVVLIGNASVEVFNAVMPPARDDLIPWGSVQVYEAATRHGPYTLIDTIVLDPLDDDPAAPMTRSFSTEAATLPLGWYMLVWLDAEGRQATTRPIPGGGTLESIAA